jgi:hypothetical protein
MTIKITDAADGDVLRAGPMAVRVLEDGTSTAHRPARRTRSPATAKKPR